MDSDADLDTDTDTDSDTDTLPDVCPDEGCPPGEYCSNLTSGPGCDSAADCAPGRICVVATHSCSDDPCDVIDTWTGIQNEG